MAEKYTADELKQILDPDKKEAKRKLPDFGDNLPKEITPPNFLKQKVGSGGLNVKILEKAQKLIDNNSVDFKPMAEPFLNQIGHTINQFEKDNPPADKHRDYILLILSPAMQLKGHGGMFGYTLVTNIANMFIQFLEPIKTLDKNALEMVNGFYAAIHAVIISEIKGDGGKDGAELLEELKAAWMRFKKKS
ncbi:MAG: hypothetical protein CMH32_02850 [Micavibrio sp.]|nr:hypothetical protein [Micavibrio sp.]HCK32284.1 hypothetical protein [Rhodospirillaceae bacterium]|tara:strand:- start:490 stop:1062 length:573 start_codon:yes stop_codon:yes gene_type:complete